jgi:UDP-3-O-[3-hydroxymyristoyl] N-acetylglucosamine deacetylase
LASLVGMGIDNAIIELDNEEVPIFDGSAAPWIHLLREVGKTTLHVGKLSWQLNQTIEVRAGKGWARLTPADNFEASVIIDFDHPAIDSQASQASWNGGEDTFSNTIARARTFGFMEQVEAMSEKGLARGGSMENAVVYSQYEVVNPQGLRVADEVAQHKLLDAIGDLAVLGRQVLAHFEAHRPGHAINQALVAQARSSGALTRVRWSQALGGWMPQERKMGPAIPR